VKPTPRRYDATLHEVIMRVLLLAAVMAAPLAAQGPDAEAKTTIDGHDLFLKPGFHISVFAKDLGGVRYLALGPGNVVYASVPGAGTIIRLPDANHDGIADTVITAVSGLRQPFGIAFRGDTMYVGETNALTRINPGAGTAPVRLVTLPSGPGHWTRTVVAGPDAKLYVAIGSSCNICDEADKRRAAVVQYNPDGTGEHIFATGLRNSVGLAFNPTSHELWANNNDRDNLGDDLPPEHVNILKDGKFYGWPQCYLPGKPNPEYPDASCANVEPPAITLQAHSAPLGLAFYTGTMFPAEYKGDGFMTLHGSWNRSIPTGAKVVRVRIQNGKATAVEDFITGWLPAGATSVAGRWGRPVGLLVLPDGSLLISDDDGGKIWRVTYGK
jgi:glucose/arabinose dehydrogenase